LQGQGLQGTRKQLGRAGLLERSPAARDNGAVRNGLAQRGAGSATAA
jgi:hypothetical protein